MRFSENRLVAWVVLSLVVVGSLSISGGGALHSLRRDTLSVFTNGAQGDGLSIQNDLLVRAEAADALSAIAKKYDDVSSGLITSLDSQVSALRETDSISQRCAANSTLSSVVENLYSALEKAPLTQEDKTRARREYKEFNSRGDTIERDPYNEFAKRFNETLDKFPASFVGGLSGVQEVEYFR